ncbi:MAG: hypothetical protein ACREPB_01290, partial [Arenimonas sp.]
MKKPVLSAVIALSTVCAMPTWAKKQTDPVPEATSFRLDYHLVLTADGSIEILKPQKEGISKLLADNVEKQIRSWKFTPGSLNGVLQRTESNLSLTLDAKAEVGGNYQIRIVDARTGAWTAPGTMVQPKYPFEQLR